MKLEHDLKDLEAQCCPPDEKTVKEKVWQPAPVGAAAAPRIEGSRLTTAKIGAPLHITAKVSSSSAVASVTLRYRHLTQYEDYASLTMTPTATPGEFAATVPGKFLVPQWDFMYFIEATDRAGHGRMWPDLATEQPYVIVKLER